MESKKFYKSLTFDSSVLLFILGILSLFGICIDAVLPEVDFIVDSIDGLIVSILALCAAYGRIRANKKLDFKLKE